MRDRSRVGGEVVCRTAENPPLDRITGERMSAHKAAKAYPWDWVVLWAFGEIYQPVVRVGHFVHRVNRAALGCRYFLRLPRTTGVRRAWDFTWEDDGAHMIILLGDVADLSAETFSTDARRIIPFLSAETLRENIPARRLRKLSFTFTGGPVEG